MKQFFLYILIFNINFCAELRKIKLNLDDSQIDVAIKKKRSKLENETDLQIGTEELETQKFFNEAYEIKNLFEGFFKSQKNLKKNFKIYQNRNLVRSRQIEQQYDLNGDFSQVFHIIEENKELETENSYLASTENNYRNGIVYRKQKNATENLLISKNTLDHYIDEFYKLNDNGLLRFKTQINMEEFREFLLKKEINNLTRKLLILNRINRKRTKINKQRKLDGAKNRRIRRRPAQKKDDQKKANKKVQKPVKKQNDNKPTTNNRSSRLGRGRQKQNTNTQNQKQAPKQNSQKNNNQKQKSKSDDKKLNRRQRLGRGRQKQDTNSQKKDTQSQENQKLAKQEQERPQGGRRQMRRRPQINQYNQDEKSNPNQLIHSNSLFGSRRKPLEKKSTTYDVMKDKRDRNQNTNIVRKINTTAQEAGYHSVDITFDKSLMEYHLHRITSSPTTLKKMGFNNVTERQAQTQISQYLDNLLQRGNGVLRKFILFKDDPSKRPIQINSTGPRCYQTPLFNPDNARLRGRPQKYTTDTIIFVDIIYKSDSPVLAEAAACAKNNNNQAEIGQMAINIAKINFQKSDHFSLYTNLMTIVHEVFHIFGFSPTFHIKIQDIAKDQDNKYLYKMRKLPENMEPLIQDEHWQPSLVPNDLMVPQERIDAILSIFSLEYLENISSHIKTNKQNLQENFLIDDINDYEELFTFTCTDQQTLKRPKFPFFCNYQEKRSGNISCDASYVYKAYCGTQLANQCFERISMKNEICMNYAQSSRNEYEIYGPDSRCFEVMEKNKQKAFCLKFTMEPDQILVHFKNNQIVNCLRSKNTSNDQASNQKIQQGDLTIYCPNYEKFLSSVKMTGCKEFCNGNGFCSNGECDCFDGYDFKDNCRTYLKTHKDMTLFSKFAIIN